MLMLGFRELIGSDTNLVTSRHIMGREKASLPFDVRCSKTPLLSKIPDFKSLSHDTLISLLCNNFI